MDDQAQIELETKLSHHEMDIEALRDTVFEHQKMIEALKSKVEKLAGQLAEGKDGGIEIGPADEKPPHY